MPVRLKEGKEPAEEVFHKQGIAGVHITLTEKDRELIQGKLEGIKKSTQLDGVDYVKHMAYNIRRDLEGWKNNFVKDEELTNKAVSLIRDMAKPFLSQEEIEKAIKDFKGAGYTKGLIVTGFGIMGGKCAYDIILMDKLIPEAFGDSPLVHEIGHYLQYWLMAQNISNDPVLKLVANHLKKFGYGNDIIVETSLRSVGSYMWYGEAFPYALERDWEMRTGKSAGKFMDERYKEYHSKILDELLKKSPKEFRKFMENPSYAVFELDYDVGERIIKSIAEQLGMEVSEKSNSGPKQA